MRRLVFPLLVVLVFGTAIVGPAVWAFRRQAETRNFRVVREGVLYRSGQMSLNGLKRVVRDYGIRTVVTLRDAEIPGEPPPDLAEELFCKAEAINHYRLPPRNWWAPRGLPPVEPCVRKFRAVMADPANYPILVHCFAGIHRTGAYCAIYRMEFERWSNADAIAELKANGYHNLDDEWDVLGYLEQYRPTWRDREETESEPRRGAEGEEAGHRTPG